MKKSDLPVEIIFKSVNPNRLLKVKTAETLKLLGQIEGVKKLPEIVFTDNKNIRKLNRLYRYKDEATDVLSFEYGKGAELPGEIIISLETAKKQALKYGNSYLTETIILLTHGFYHILGYTHYRKQAYRKMKKKEEAALLIFKKKRILC
ncbi:MAG: rRNA maturation RNase YbeY [Candidatus Firestonebacteria bacterium]